MPLSDIEVLRARVDELSVLPNIVDRLVQRVAALEAAAHAGSLAEAVRLMERARADAAPTLILPTALADPDPEDHGG